MKYFFPDKHVLAVYRQIRILHLITIFCINFRELCLVLFKLLLLTEKYCIICKNISKYLRSENLFSLALFIKWKLIVLLSNDVDNYLFLSLSGSKSSQFWFTLPSISHQWRIKIRFCMGFNHVICTKFSWQFHDALTLAGNHICRRDQLFYYLRGSCFEVKRVEKVRIFFL